MVTSASIVANFSAMSFVEKLIAHLTRSNHTLNLQIEYFVEAVIQLSPFSGLKAGSNSRCGLCSSVLHGLARLQRLLTQSRKHWQEKSEDIICIESPSAVLSERSNDYIH